MAYHHRRLIQESINISVSDLCTGFCDPSNDLGFCATPCLSICSSICHYSLSSLVPPTYTPVSFTPGDQSSKIHKLFPFLIITLAVLATAFVLVCHYTIYVRFYSRRRRSQLQPQSDDNDRMIHDEFLDEEHGPELDHPIWYIRTVGLQSSVISAITICKYKKGDGLVEGTECSVCLSEFQEGETLRLLPKCNHAFHIPCIDTWLGSHTNCPMCRAGIVVNIAGSPSPELNVDNSGISEETQVRISENEESGRERDDRVGELRDETVEESELRVEIVRKKHENSKKGLGGIKPMRRSVSMDSASAFVISLALANDVPLESKNNAEKQPVKVSDSNMGTVPERSVGSQNLLRLMGSSSIGRPQQEGSSSMKRSLSCTGKFLLSTYSRSRNSTLPL